MKLATGLALILGMTSVIAEEKLSVASLSTVLTDIAENVGRDQVMVSALVKPDIDPHNFSPTAQDVRTISKSRVVLLSGSGMEDAYLAKLEKSVGAGPMFVAVGDSIKPIMLEEEDSHEHEHSHAGHGTDPHWWHSVKNVETATKAVRDAFIKADPAHRDEYEANARTYTKQLEELDKWARIQIARLPRDKRVLVTSHDAFGYFARDYGFSVFPIEGISTEDQPSSKKVREIIEVVRAKGVKSIFLENIENPKVLTEITKETGAKTGGVLFADGLGEGAETYQKMIRHNYAAIISGLE